MPRSGRGALLLIGLLALAGLALGLGVLWIGGVDEPGGLQQQPVTPTVGSSPRGAALAPQDAESSTRAHEVAKTPAEIAAEFHSSEEFQGRGSIRGRVMIVEGLDFPESWAIHVGPSRSLRGRTRALSKIVEASGDSREFVVEDLPLGGYDVWVEAEGLRARRRAVLLTKGSPSPYVNLELGRMGFIDGYVYRDGGAPAEDLLISLEPIPSDVRREVRTRPDGSYRFDNVEDGEYRLHFGPAETPLSPARDLHFRAPSMRFPPTTLPATGELLIHTQDRSGAIMPNVTVTGFGTKGGLIEVQTNDEGQAWARHLPPGRYKLQAKSPDGRRARQTLDVTIESDQHSWLILQ